MVDGELLTPIDPSILFKVHDPNVERLSDIITQSVDAYQSTDIVLVGVPQDIGVARNNGRVGAALAPDCIRKALYKLAPTHSLSNLKIHDLGNIKVEGELEEIHERVYTVLRQILTDGKVVVVFGGGNDISYPDCSALSDLSERVLAFNVDKHFDARNMEPRNSGTPYRMLLEEEKLIPELFFEVGSEPFANEPYYVDYLKRKGVNVVPLAELRRANLEAWFGKVMGDLSYDSIFWGFDMDSVRASDAPGVSASYPTGLTAEECLAIAHLAGKNDCSRVFEITELNPNFDIDNRTCKLAAIMTFTFMNART